MKTYNEIERNFEDMAEELFFLYDYMNDMKELRQTAKFSENENRLQVYNIAIAKTDARILHHEKIAESVLGLNVDELRKRANELLEARDRKFNA